MKKKGLKIALSLAAFFLSVASSAPARISGDSATATAPVPLSQYLSYAWASADWVWGHYQELVDKWKQSFEPDNVFGYRPPAGLLEMAVIYAYLYEKEKKPDYGERAKKVLLSYRDFRSLYPDWAKEKRPDYEDGVPVLPDFFTVMRYIRAYDILRRLNLLDKPENQKIEAEIAHSIEYLLRSQE